MARPIRYSKAELKARKTNIKRIDADFTRMKNDARYRREAAVLTKEFSVSDWDASRRGEKELGGS
jgi:hypothetical protein